MINYIYHNYTPRSLENTVSGRVHHFHLDEFQNVSGVQWRSCFPSNSREINFPIGDRSLKFIEVKIAVTSPSTYPCANSHARGKRRRWEHETEVEAEIFLRGDISRGDFSRLFGKIRRFLARFAPIRDAYKITNVTQTPRPRNKTYNFMDEKRTRARV